MRMKHRAWCWVLAAVLTLALILTVFCWDTIVIYAASKAVLTGALQDTISQLDVRFRYNPIRNTLDQYSPEGRYTASVTLETETEHLGHLSCDLAVQTDAVSHQASVDGVLHSKSGDLNLSLYLNDTGMAISSEELLAGRYYGITYDTFASDLNHFPLLKYVIPAATVTRWEKSLDEIQSVMSRPYQPPEITREDIRYLMAGILLLDTKVSRGTVQGLDCYVITYSAAGQEVRDLLGYVLDVNSTDTGEIAANFYLHNRKLVCVELACSAGENALQCRLDLGEQCRTDDLHLTVQKKEQDQSAKTVISVSTQSSGPFYQETVSVTGDSCNEVRYSWDSDNGDMIFSWNSGMPIRLNVTQKQDGLHVSTADFAQLFSVMTGRSGKSGREVAAVMTLKPGTVLTAPEYTNLDAWSYEDLLTLLKGLGGLLGLPN